MRVDCIEVMQHAFLVLGHLSAAHGSSVQTNEQDVNCYTDVRHDKEICKMQSLLLTWTNSMKKVNFLPGGVLDTFSAIHVNNWNDQHMHLSISQDLVLATYCLLQSLYWPTIRPSKEAIHVSRSSNGTGVSNKPLS